MKLRIQTGYTMLEVLVAAIILMVALLGMGALQSTAMKRNTSAINKTYAMESATYIGDAIKSQLSTKAISNQGVSADYQDFTADFWGDGNYQSNLVEDCGSGCTRDVMTKHMLAEWERMIGENLPKGQGKITSVVENKRVDGSDVQTTYYEIVVMWDDRQRAQSTDGSEIELGTGCSGNPKVDLTCMTTIIRP
jgi:type IV pilus modification protein PilV